MTPDDVLTFWFSEGARAHWFELDDAFDDEVRRGFADVYENARQGGLRDWEQTPRGLLALVIVMDQFPRNMFRGSARAYESDAAALRLAQSGVASGFDSALVPEQRQFLYMPYMHSETLAVQDQSVALFASLDFEDSADFAREHREIIARFARFPHRNAALGRRSTAEEEAFLASHTGF
jgi:uncharacterized protein (DUF924 family)